MKKWIIIFTAAIAGSLFAEGLLDPVNELGYGTLKARLQTLSMYRDYEGPGDGYSTTLGLKLDYLSPEVVGLSGGASWIYVEPIHYSGGIDKGKTLLLNGRVNMLNELWAQYRFGVIGLSNTTVRAGRQVVNGEVFRKDEFRQKPRALEAIVLTTKDIPDTVLTIGHVERLSNVWDTDSHAWITWEFDDIEDVLTRGKVADTRGVDWAEAVYIGITNLELAVYDAYAHDIANIIGARAKYTVCSNTALVGYYRHENSVQQEVAGSYAANMYGLSVQQKIGGVSVDAGWLGVKGGNLLFEELGTGINHPLGSSMMIYPGMFLGGADTVYLKAVTKLDKTVLYMLYHYTWHDHAKTAYDGQELDVVIKQPVGENLSVALKVGAGYRDWKGANDTTALDARLFLTYNF